MPYSGDKFPRRETMSARTPIPLILLSLLSLAGTAVADSAWVSDEFEVMLRTGPSTSNAIERMLPSGTALEILERDADSGYSRVRTEAGTEGWVLSRYLMEEPSAREQLAALTRRLTDANSAGSSLSGQLDAVQEQYDEATAKIASLERDKARLENELAEIRRTAADVLAINDQNEALRERLNTAETSVGAFEQQIRDLTGQTTRYWFMTGALVLIVGIIMGLWLPRIRWQRRSRYDRF